MARVLVVDDSEDILDALESVLTDEGFDVACAPDGAKGLELVRQVRPHVILVDMMMPEMDGLEFLSRLAAEPAPPPVVANSSFDCFRDEALRRGAVAFLVKPASASVLISTLRSAIDGQPVQPAVLAENAATVERTRREALDRATRAVEQLDRAARPDLREGLERIARWVPPYFGYGTCIVHVLRGSDCCVEAIHNGSVQFHEGIRYPRETTFCDDVIATGSMLVLPDPAHHPCARYACHPKVEEGWRSYAGVPLTTPSGAVLGTLCIVDKQPRSFRAPDVFVLETLGLATACGMETGAWPIDEHGALTKEHLGVFVDVAATRAARPGGAAVAMLVEALPRAPVAMGLAAVHLDGCMALLWAGLAGGWSPPEALVGHVLARADVSGVTDRDEARGRIRSVLARPGAPCHVTGP
jgi:CheY-like chemotaxis protein